MSAPSDIEPQEVPASPIFEPHFASIDLLRALGDERRLVMLGRLARSDRPLNVTEVSSCCGIHLSGVSRHLAILRQTGIVSAERSGREVVYQLEYSRVISALRELADTFEAHLSKTDGELGPVESPEADE